MNKLSEKIDDLLPSAEGVFGNKMRQTIPILMLLLLLILVVVSYHFLN